MTNDKNMVVYIQCDSCY